MASLFSDLMSLFELAVSEVIDKKNGDTAIRDRRVQDRREQGMRDMVAGALKDPRGFERWKRKYPEKWTEWESNYPNEAALIRNGGKQPPSPPFEDPNTVAGWYRQINDFDNWRYWDGSQWTPHTAPVRKPPT
jgi:Protein of unknown function (DUF2510)